MFELFRKVNRSIEHPNGAKKVEKGENPFLEGPCLICVSPQDTINRTIFGFTKHGARMARVRVRGNTEGRIPLDEIPVSFYLLSHQKEAMKAIELLILLIPI